MNIKKLKIRRQGILLNYSRIDKSSVREYWLYKRKEFSFPVYDPSPFYVTEEVLQASEKEFESTKRFFNLVNSRNKRLRENGKARFSYKKNKKLLKKWKDGQLLQFSL